MAIISLENVSYSYDKKVPAIKGLSFSVNRGEYVAIVGHNGSGKSTIAKLLNALILPDSGEVNVCGFSSSNKKSLFDIRKRVGVVFQNPDNQLGASVVEDDIAFGPENLGIDRKEIGERIEFALKSVGMEKYRKNSTDRLSGGQKQRIAIAGVLALKPEILILDESTSMLDPKGREEVLSVVKKLNKEQGVTIIAITHYMEEVVNADKIFGIKNGELVLSGNPSEVFSKKDKIVALGLEPPLASIIADKLREGGLPLPQGILTKERLGEELCKL